MDKEKTEAMIRALKFSGDNADSMRARAESECLKFFIVENTAKRRAYYLAETARFAKLLAKQNGQVEDLKNAHVLIPNDRFWEKQQGFRGAINRAIADGKPGHIEQRGQFAVLADKVFTPIGEAE